MQEGNVPIPLPKIALNAPSNVICLPSNSLSSENTWQISLWQITSALRSKETFDSRREAVSGRNLGHKSHIQMFEVG